MRTFELDAVQMIDKASAHKYIKQMLGFPDYYGCNLDALWDILSTQDFPAEIRLLNSGCLFENLGEYAAHLISVFEDVSCCNPNLIFIIE